MATVPQPHSWTAGDNATSSVMQTITDGVLWNLGSTTSTGARRPLFRGLLTVAQTLTTGVSAAVALDTETVDYDSGHTGTGSRYTANTAGYHAISGNVQFAANGTGVRLAFLAVNGTERTGTRVEVAPSAAGTLTGVATHSDLIFLNVADYVEIYAQQTSGGNLNVTSGALCVEWRSN